MAEVARPVIRRIYETVLFDPEIGSYRAVVIRVEYPAGIFHDIPVRLEEYDPEKVEEYVRGWLKRYGKWVGREIKLE